MLKMNIKVLKQDLEEEIKELTHLYSVTDNTALTDIDFKKEILRKIKNEIEDKKFILNEIKEDLRRL